MRLLITKKSMLLFWVVVFVLALAALVKGADWLLQSAEKIGLAMGLSSFVVGVVIVGLGTSFPELISSIAAVMKDATEIVTANAVGSNIANILLIVGISAVIGGRLAVTKNLIDLDLPLLALSTVFFLGISMDGVIRFGEAVLLIVLFVIYILYTIYYIDDSEVEDRKLPDRSKRRKLKTAKKEETNKEKLKTKDFVYLAFGILGLVIGAKYLIDAVINISALLNIGTGVIALVAVAFGTSLPELLVSIKAALANKPEVALGNVFGSNVFNFLIVVGIPGLFKTLYIDEPTIMIGIPFMAGATLLFIISGISRRVHAYEGAMFIVIYVLFIGKLFGLM